MSKQIKPFWSITLREANILSAAISYRSDNSIVVAFPEYVDFTVDKAREIIQSELTVYDQVKSREVVPSCKFPWRINRANIRYLKEREQDLVCYVSNMYTRSPRENPIKRFFDLAAQITLADENPSPCSFMVYTPSKDTVEFFEKMGFENRATKITTDPDQPKLRIDYLINQENGEEVYIQTPLENGASHEVVRQFPFSVDELTASAIAEFFDSHYW